MDATVSLAATKPLFCIEFPVCDGYSGPYSRLSLSRFFYDVDDFLSTFKIPFSPFAFSQNPPTTKLQNLHSSNKHETTIRNCVPEARLTMSHTGFNLHPAPFVHLSVYYGSFTLFLSLLGGTFSWGY
jgi:hypothetical protein